MKSILIISPRFFNYEQYLTTEFLKLGYKPTYLDERLDSFFENVISRVGLKTLLKKKNFKRIKSFISDTNSNFVDILFISPETTSNNEILFLKSHFPNARFILYMWDSLKNKKAKHLISYFDKRITFDFNDYKQQSEFHFLPLYFNPEHYKKVDLPKIYDLNMCCSLHSDRYKLFRKLKRISTNNNLNFYHHLYVKNKWLLLFFRVKILITQFTYIRKNDITFESLSPSELNKIYNQSKATIDINHPHQNGLTNRTFEVLATTSKLITTNTSIRKYDFYHPKQISILKRNKLQLPDRFLDEQGIKVDLTNYTLQSWIKQILI